MKIGPLELRLVETSSGAWMYEVYHQGFVTIYGYRPREVEARQAGLEDAHLLRSFV
jgi:hypothetical protein